MSLQSLLISRRGSNRGTRIYLVQSGFSDADLKKIQDLVEGESDAGLNVISFDPSAHFRGRQPFGLMAYAPLVLPSLIPEDDVLFLDSDVIVANSLDGLAAEAVGAELAAVPEGIAGESNCREFLAAKGVERNTPYFNTGVMWIDLQAWRRDSVGAGLINLGESVGWALPTGDQTLLNWHYRGRFRALSAAYNKYLYSTALSGGAVDASAAIYHFLGRPKPWELLGGVNLQYRTFEALRRRMGLKMPPIGFGGYSAALFRLRRYAPSYLKCMSRRLTALV